MVMLVAEDDLSNMICCMTIIMIIFHVLINDDDFA